MRKATSAGLDQAGVPVAVLRSPSGLGRRTPKKNARKRIILQEKISRELSASRNRVSDGQVNVHRCVSLAASLQDQLIEIAHKLKEALHADSGRDSPAVVGDLVDQLCQVQLLHQAVHHSLELLQNAADKLLQAERATHVLESNTCSSPGAETASKVPASAPPPAVLSNFGHLDAGAFFSAAADAPLPSSNAQDNSPYPTPMLSQHLGEPHTSTAVPQSPNGCRPSPIAARMSSCSTVTDVDTSRMSQPLPAALAADPARGDEDEADFFSRSCSAQIHTHWASASGPCPSPWLSCALEPAPSAPSPSVWQMTDAEKLHAQRAMLRTRTAGAGGFGTTGVEGSPVLQPCDPPAAHASSTSPTDAQLYAERSLSAPLRHATETTVAATGGASTRPPFERVHSSEVATSSATARAASGVHSTQHAQNTQQPNQPPTGAAALPFPSSSPVQPQIASNVNAWLQASSSEDESEDPRGDNRASLMLNLLAPGVPPDILHCLSLSNPTSSDMSTLHARGSGGSGGHVGCGQGVAGAQSALASPNPTFSRSRSDADALLHKSHAPHASHAGSASAHLLRLSANGALHAHNTQNRCNMHNSHMQQQFGRNVGSNVPPPLPQAFAEVQDMAASYRMPSEGYLEEASSQAHAVVSALHAAFSSLERVALQMIRRAAEELRVSTPMLHQTGSKPSSVQGSMHVGHAWSPWSAHNAASRQLSNPCPPGPGFSGGPFAQAGVWPGALSAGGGTDFQRMASAPHPLSHHMGTPPGWGSGQCGMNSHSMLSEREYSLPFPGAHVQVKQPLLQHSHPAHACANTAPRQWQPFISEFALASNSYAPQPPAQQMSPMPPPPPPPQQHQLSGTSSYPAHRLPSAESLHLPPPLHSGHLSSAPPGAPPLDLLQRHPSDKAGGLANAFAEHLLRAFSCSNATDAANAKRTQSAGPGMGFDSPASHMHVHAGEWPQGPHVSTMVFPRCEVCAVRSNSAKSLTAHLESKGHQRKIMLQAILVCEAVVGASGASQTQGGSNATAGNNNQNNSSNGAQGNSLAKNNSSGKEEGSATLLQYRKHLPDVRVADDGTSKDVLGLLFQLVQMQIRKAEKFRENLPRAHKRCLAGMKEVAWAVSKPGQAKLVLIAPNIQIPCPDSILLAQVRDLVAKCRDVGVPVIMGPSRKQLGMAFRTSEGSKSTFKLMSAVALLDISGAEPQWNDIMTRFTTLPLAADVEEALEATTSQNVPEASMGHMHASAPAPEAGLTLTPHSAFAQAAVASTASGNGSGVSFSHTHSAPVATGGVGERRGLVPVAAAVVERVRREVRGRSSLKGIHSVKSFQNILECASVLLTQVVSLGSRLSSSGSRLQSF